MGWLWFFSIAVITAIVVLALVPKTKAGTRRVLRRSRTRIRLFGGWLKGRLLVIWTLIRVLAIWLKGILSAISIRPSKIGWRLALASGLVAIVAVLISEWTAPSTLLLGVGLIE